MKNVAAEEGILYKVAAKYPNYAIGSTSATALYGTVNAKRLARIRDEVDPDGVMRLLVLKCTSARYDVSNPVLARQSGAAVRRAYVYRVSGKRSDNTATATRFASKQKI